MPLGLGLRANPGVLGLPFPSQRIVSKQRRLLVALWTHIKTGTMPCIAGSSCLLTSSSRILKPFLYDLLFVVVGFHLMFKIRLWRL